MPVCAASELILLPFPRFLDLNGDSLNLPDGGQVIFEGISEAGARLAAEMLVEALVGAGKRGWNTSF